MSKRRSFGRFTAMGLAGLTAVSSMAIVANAEAFPTDVYEFTYGGISSTKMFAKVSSAAINNDYVSEANARGVFTTGYVVEGLDDFSTIISDANASNFTTINFDKSSKWTYYDVNVL